MMFTLENTPGRTCIVDGKEYLFFSGYSYLGMNHILEFTEQVKEGIEKYGVLFPSSRISNTSLTLYDEFENDLSLLTGMEETVSFSSGYLAGKTIAEILSSYKNVFVAPHTHPAIVITTKDKKNFENFKVWSTYVTDVINSSDENEFVLVSDSVNILESTVNDFSFAENIKSTKKIIFLIDDSHGIGILRKGKGLIPHLPKKENLEYIICYSLSKAFNIEGGAVSCSKYFADKLRQHSNYAGSTAINPSLAYAFLNSKNLYDEQREKLMQNINYTKKNLPASACLRNDFDLPVFVCENENLPAGQAGAEKFFYKNNMIISSFRYPTPQSKKVNRVVINALHTKTDLDKLCSLLANYSL